MGLLEYTCDGTASVEQPPVLPCPGFEGFEKRLEVEFEYGTVGGDASMVSSRGLRDIPREELDLMLSAAQCTIVSKLSNKQFDSYVLSESSLFVYKTTVVIKTCGTTRLLCAIPQLLASAAALSLLPSACRYTRGSFIFPDAQPAPYSDFSAEAAVLEKHFGHLGNGGRAYVMGDALSGSNWHIYNAHSSSSPSASPYSVGATAEAAKEAVLTLEVCMTELDGERARVFFADSGVGNAKSVTAVSGIGGLLPGAEIDDFSFQPCGYSMNSIQGECHSTIHVTPEDGFSYASFETRGYSHSSTDLSSLLLKVLSVFKPGRMSVALHADGVPSAAALAEADSWFSSLGVPLGYWCCSSSQQQLPGGGTTVFHTFRADHTTTHPYSATPLPLLSSPLGSPMLESAGPLLSPCLQPLVAKTKLPGMPVHEGRRASAEDWEWAGEQKGDAAHKGMLGMEVEATEAVLQALRRRGQRVEGTVSALHPVLLAKGEAELDGLCMELIAARKDGAGGARGAQAESAFYVMDVGEVLRLWDHWVGNMPRVHPFYAVKCNPDKTLLSLLASLGAGFDVASLAELEAVSEACGGGVPDASRIIFANPCKLPSHIMGAAARGVHLTTFDSESELQKLKKSDPNAKAVLRIRVDDPSARCPLGVKYGAELSECRRLLYTAKRLGVKVEGVAFHVGSGAGATEAFSLGVAAARHVFDTAAAVGFPRLSVLDIGGGFTADGSVAGGVCFKDAAAAISAALDLHFPLSAFPGLRVIAEPGRFFAETPFTLVAHVFGTRARGRGNRRRHEYWINDGIYGSMNSLLYDHAVLSVRPLRTESAPAAAAMPSTRLGSLNSWAASFGHSVYPGRSKQNRLFSSTVFGPTCDGLDTVMRDVLLPKLQCGDWLVFPRMGAYTKAAGSSFNGFAVEDIKVAAYVLTSALAHPFYAAPVGKHFGSGRFFGSVWEESKGGDVVVGELEWGVLEGLSASSEDEDGAACLGDDSTDGSDNDE